MRILISLFLVLVIGAHAETPPLQKLIEAAKSNSEALKQLLPETLSGLNHRGASAVWGHDFLFAVETEKAASVSIDRQPPAAMKRVPASNLWYTVMRLQLGTTHHWHFLGDGKSLGEAFQYDVAGYGPDSYPQPGTPKGALSEKKTIASKAYPGSATDYWVYVSPGYDPERGAALMVWHDGQSLIRGDLSAFRLFTVTENLVHQKLIPPMIHVMVAPGTGGGMRRLQYDTVSDRYGRFLLEEVLAEVEKSYKLRADAYSRGISGQSSGGISSFNVAWHFPNQFSRVLSHIGTFTAVTWNPEENVEGGHSYPFRVRRDPRKNIRIWLSDGSNDNENPRGSWPLQNIQLANSLKMQEYDFHFRFGEGMHSNAQGALDLPESLAWLWRNYDPTKTHQTYEIEAIEREKPLFRVKIANRDAW